MSRLAYLDCCALYNVSVVSQADQNRWATELGKLAGKLLCSATLSVLVDYAAEAAAALALGEQYPEAVLLATTALVIEKAKALAC